MGNFDYKSDIINTRTGALGSSDGKMLMQIAEYGKVPKSAYKRLAVCKGLIPQVEIPHTDAVRAGDEMENAIYEMLAARNEKYESNPCWVSKKYSKDNVNLLTHPDIVFVNEKKKVIYIYEVKTTKHSVEDTKNTYLAQIYIHYVIGMERAKEMGEKWTVKIFLVHYSTDGLDLSNGVCLEPNRLTIKKINFTHPLFDINKAMTIVSEFLKTFDSYYEGDEVESKFLPEKVKEQFLKATNILRQIAEQQKQVDEFKKKLCEFMQTHNIHSIKNDEWNIALVEATESHSFDSKRFLSDFANEHPRKAKALLKTYDKCSKRSAYCKISIKNKDK